MSYQTLDEVTGLGKTITNRNKYDRVPFVVGQIEDEVSFSDGEQKYFIQKVRLKDNINDETKTHEDDDDPGVIPVIEPLRDVLDGIKPEIASGWMFPNTIGGALDLDNLADRVIKPVFKANCLKWKGWHAYRRGLATNLHELGVPDKVIQAILRHEDVSTTQRSYIKTVPRVVTDAMKQLEAKIARAAVVQQAAVN